MRYEIPALIVVEADTADSAMLHADQFGEVMLKEEGPGAFFHNIGVVRTDLPEGCEEDREAESVPQHVRSLAEARGV